MNKVISFESLAGRRGRYSSSLMSGPKAHYGHRGGSNTLPFEPLMGAAACCLVADVSFRVNHLSGSTKLHLISE